MTTDSGDGGPGPAARLLYPWGLARDKAGNLYIADVGNHRVRVLRPDGTLQAFAGTGVQGFGGDGGPAKQALLDTPSGLAVTTDGTVYIRDGHRIRRVSPEGEISSVAGPGLPVGPPRIADPTAVAADDAGNLFIADFSRSRVFRVDREGNLTTYAEVQYPTALALAPDGTLFVSDTISLPTTNPDFPRTTLAIQSVTPDGVVHSMVGSNRSYTVPRDGMDASLATSYVTGMAVDAQGNLVFANSDSGRDTVFRVGADLVLHQVAITRGGWNLAVTDRGTLLRSSEAVYEYQIGSPGSDGYNTRSAIAGQTYNWTSSDGGPAPEGGFESPSLVVASPSGGIFLSDPDAGKIWKLDRDGKISLAAAISTRALAVSPAGELYVSTDNVVSKFAADGALVPVAGNGQPPFGVPEFGDPHEGAKATEVTVGADSLAFDRLGTLYISDRASGVVWRLTPDGILHKATPSVENTYSAMPLATDAEGSVWFLNDRYDGRVLLKKIGVGLEPAVVRNLGAAFQSPRGFALDATGNVYVTTASQPFVCRIDSAGSAVALTDSRVRAWNSPSSLSFDSQGNLFVIDSSGGSLWRFDSPSTCSGQRFPMIDWRGIVNNASFEEASAAPGEMIAVFGIGVGPGTPAGGVVEDGHFTTSAGGTQLLVDGVPAPIVYASSSQTVAIVPFGTEGQSGAHVEVSVDGLVSNEVELFTKPYGVGLFTRNASGKGPGAILNEDYTVNSAERPAKRGSVIMVYATGLGPLNPIPEDGALAGSAPATHTLAYSATVGGRPAEVIYAGAAPGLVVGVSQVNVRVPADAPAGLLPIAIRPVGGSQAYSQDVTVYVE